MGRRHLEDVILGENINHRPIARFARTDLRPFAKSDSRHAKHSRSAGETPSYPSDLPAGPSAGPERHIEEGAVQAK